MTIYTMLHYVTMLVAGVVHWSKLDLPVCACVQLLCACVPVLRCNWWTWDRWGCSTTAWNAALGLCCPPPRLPSANPGCPYLFGETNNYPEHLKAIYLFLNGTRGFGTDGIVKRHHETQRALLVSVLPCLIRPLFTIKVYATNWEKRTK